jgi:predicted nucleic acid-binding protein
LPVLVDTSVWIDHFRRRSTRLSRLLDTLQVSIHPFVIGELACGNLARRTEVLGLLQALPQLPPVDHHEALQFIGAHRLQGRGLGWVDMHLLASARLAHVALWTLDKRLEQASIDIGL